MAPALARLAKLQAELDARGGHELVGPGSVHASLIEGGQELSSYPARCVLSLERRTEPREEPDVVERECEALVEGIDGAEVRIGLVRPPFSVDPGADVVQSVARAAERVSGRPAELYGETYWMDAALIQAAGSRPWCSDRRARVRTPWTSGSTSRALRPARTGLVAAARELCA